MTNWNRLEVTRIEQTDPDVVIYRLSGVLTNSRQAYEFLENLQAEIRKSPKNIVLVLRDVERITSAGVGIIAASFTSSAQAGKKLVLASIPDQGLMVLNVVRFLTVMEHYPNEEEAIAHLA